MVGSTRLIVGALVFVLFGLPLLIVAVVPLVFGTAVLGTLGNVADMRAPGLETELPVLDVSSKIALHNDALQRACAEHVQRRRPGSRDFDMSLVRGPIWVSLANSGPFMECLMTHEVTRFCIASERKKLIGLLDQLLAAHRRRASELAKIMADPASATIATLSREMDDLASIRNRDVETAQPDPGQPDLRVLRALQGLTHNGYFTQRDFGRAPPREIAPYLEKPQMEPCAS